MKEEHQGEIISAELQAFSDRNKYLFMNNQPDPAEGKALLQKI